MKEERYDNNNVLVAGQKKSISRLFDNTTAWEKLRKKEQESRNNHDVVQILMLTALLFAICGVYGFTVVAELDTGHLRYSKYISIGISIFSISLGALIIRLALNQRAGFRSNSKMIRSWIVVYILFGCCSMFEISLLNNSSVNIAISIAGIIQSMILLPVIFDGRNIFEPVFSHGALMYIQLRLIFEYDWWNQCPVSSSISLVIIVISAGIRAKHIHAKITDKQDEFEQIQILKRDIVNIQAFYQNVLQCIPHGIGFIDEQMIVKYSNQNLQTMLNYPQNENLFSALNALAWASPEDVSSKEQAHQSKNQISSKLNIQDKSRPLIKATASNRLIQLPETKSSREIQMQKNSTSEKNLPVSRDILPTANHQTVLATGKDLQWTTSKVLLCVPQEDINCRTNDNIEVRERVTSIERQKNKTKDNSNTPKMVESVLFKLAEPSNKSPRKCHRSSKESLSEIFQKIFLNSKKDTPATLINLQQNKNSSQNKNISDNQQFQNPSELKMTSKNPLENSQNDPKKDKPKPKRGISTSYTAAESLFAQGTLIHQTEYQSVRLNNQSNEQTAKMQSPPQQDKVNNGNILLQGQKIAQQQLKLHNLGLVSREQCCELQANDMEGKKLNLKIILFEQNWGEVGATQLEQEEYPSGRQGPKQDCKQIKTIQDTREPVILILIEDLSQAQIVKKLENQNEYKMRMLASVSHELRTPLNCSISMLQIMRDNLTQLNQFELIKDNLDPALYSSKLLLNLINDILDFAQLEAGKFMITCQEFNLKQIFLECFVLISIQSKMKNLRLKLQMGITEEQEYKTTSQLETAFEYEADQSQRFMINSDPNRVRQIILNLLSNALKFTNAGSITLKAQILSTKPRSIQITCEDTGIGISPDRCRTIFDNFNKADMQNRIKYNQCGAGLGLSISNQLVKVLCPPENTDIPIVVVSEEGKGSSFSFIIQDQIAGNVTGEQDDRVINFRADSTTRCEGSLLNIQDSVENSSAEKDVDYPILEKNNTMYKSASKLQPPQVGTKAFQSTKKSQFGKNKNSKTNGNISTSKVPQGRSCSLENIDYKNNVTSLSLIKTHEDSVDSSKMDFLYQKQNKNNFELDGSQIHATVRPLTSEEPDIEAQMMSVDPEHSIRGPSYIREMNEIMFIQEQQDKNKKEDEIDNEAWKDKYFDVSSPTKTRTLQPQVMEVARNELQLKKIRESQSFQINYDANS